MIFWFATRELRRASKEELPELILLVFSSFLCCFLILILGSSYSSALRSFESALSPIKQRSEFITLESLKDSTLSHSIPKLSAYFVIEPVILLKPELGQGFPSSLKVVASGKAQQIISSAKHFHRLEKLERLRVTFQGKTYSLPLKGTAIRSEDTNDLEGKIVIPLTMLPEQTQDSFSHILLLPRGQNSKFRNELLKLGTQLSKLPSADSLIGAFSDNILILSLSSLIVFLLGLYQVMKLRFLSKKDETNLLLLLGLKQTKLISIKLLESGALALLGAFLGLLVFSLIGEGIIDAIGRNLARLYLGNADLFLAELTYTPKSITLLALSCSVSVVLLSIWGAVYEDSKKGTSFKARFAKLSFTLSVFLLILTLVCSYLFSFAPTSPKAYFCILVLFAAVLSVSQLSFKLLSPYLLKLLQGSPRAYALLTCSHLRSQRASAALSISVFSLAATVMISLGMFISSFQSVLSSWTEATLKADAYIRPVEQKSLFYPSTITDQTLSKLRKSFPEASFEAVSQHMVNRKESIYSVVSLPMESLRKRQSYPLLSGAYPHNFSREVLISESYAKKYGISVGASLGLASLQLQIAGVVQDYSSEHGVVYLDSSLFVQLFPNKGVTGIGVFAETMNKEEILEIERFIKEANLGLEFLYNRELKDEVDRIFRSTFFITDIIRFSLVLFCAFSLSLFVLQLILQRKTRFGICSTLGLRSRDFVFSSAIESSLIPVSAFFISIPAGTLLGVIICKILAPSAFGWAFPLTIGLDVYAYPILSLVSAYMLSLFMPIFRIQRIEPILVEVSE
jgi:ABC-type antimicrobial peptide transport system permease subunit